MRGPLIRSALMALVLVLALGSTARAASYTILAGPVGGGWYILAAGIAQVVHNAYPDIDLKVVPGGAVANPARVGGGTADFGLSLPAPALLAMNGQGIYTQKYPDIRAIAFGFSEVYLQIVALKEFPYDSLADALAKKAKMRVTVSDKATFDNWVDGQMLAMYGASPELIKQWGGAYYEVSHTQQQDLLRNEQADVLISLLALPAPDVIDVASSREVKFLAMSPEVQDKLVAQFGFVKGAIQPSVYKGYKVDMPREVPTVTMLSGLIVNPKVPDDVVYKVTKALYDRYADVQKIHPSMSDFVPKTVANPQYRANGQIQMAPGAIKYFKEAGLKYE